MGYKEKKASWSLCKLIAKGMNMLTLTVLSGCLFVVFVVLILSWVMLLSGCSVAAFFLSGCGSPNADLVVINESDKEVYSIVLEYENSTETVQAASGSALFGPDQTYGLELEEGEVLVILRDRAQGTIGQSRITRQEGKRLYLTFDGGMEGSLSVEERPHG